MKINGLFVGMLGMVLALGMMVVGCKTDDDPVLKTIVITGLPDAVYDGTTDLAQVGVYPTGTSISTALAYTGLVAGADESLDSISHSGAPGNWTLTADLYVGTSSTRWDGTGTYDVFLVTDAPTYFKAGSIAISSATTTIPYSSFTAVSP